MAQSTSTPTQSQQANLANIKQKLCIACKTDKSLDRFPAREVSKGGRKRVCRECVNAAKREKWLKKTLDTPDEFYEHFSQGLVWEEIPGFPNYRIGEDGTFWSNKKPGKSTVNLTNPSPRWRRKKTSVTNGGYYSVYVKICGKKQMWPIHRVLLAAFVGPCPEGMECRHLDGNPKNNSLSNLAWGTPAENAQDKIRHGTQVEGEKVASAKLTAIDVKTIKIRLDNGEMVSVIAKDYPNVSRSSISMIKTNRTWKHIKCGETTHLQE